MSKRGDGPVAAERLKVLLAEDDSSSRALLAAHLTKWGYEVVEARDGAEAWRALQEPDAPRLALLDWWMPKLDGAEVCRRLRESASNDGTYAIILTAKRRMTDLVEAFEAGADDYLSKPADREELQARLRVGARMLELQGRLARRVRDLEAANAEIRQLQEILPICSYCKKVRDDTDYWQEVEEYFAERADTRFSHAICPHCYEERVTPELAEWILSQQP